MLFSLRYSCWFQVQVVHLWVMQLLWIPGLHLLTFPILLLPFQRATQHRSYHPSSHSWHQRSHKDTALCLGAFLDFSNWSSKTRPVYWHRWKSLLYKMQLPLFKLTLLTWKNKRGGESKLTGMACLPQRTSARVPWTIGRAEGKAAWGTCPNFIPIPSRLNDNSSSHCMFQFTLFPLKCPQSIFYLCSLYHCYSKA